MSRPAPALPISPRAFKHFAAITLVITLCVAMFAEGESRNAIVQEVEHVELRNAELRAEAQKLGKRHLAAHGLKFRDEKRSFIAFAPDEPAEAESRIESSVGSGVRAGIGRNAQLQPSVRPYTGIRIPPRNRRGRQAAGSGSQDEEQSVELAEAASSPRRPTEAQLTSITSASLARSGEASE